MNKQNPVAGETRDPLTGLPDRAAFRALLDAERERSARSHQPFGLVFFDIDRFKVVNYGYGVQHGDALLMALAELARQALRGGEVRNSSVCCPTPARASPRIWPSVCAPPSKPPT